MLKKYNIVKYRKSIKHVRQLRSCPKCHKGDMFRDDHCYQCLQCGYMQADETPAILVEVETTKTEVTDNG